jgi:hypothetical protein
LHNWSANNQKEPLEIIQTSSRNNNNIEDLIKSMKQANNNPMTRQGKILNKVLTVSNGYSSGGILTSRGEEGAPLSYRNQMNININDMD